MSQATLISWLLLAAHVLIVLVAAVLISANRKPSAAIAWILAVIFIPVLGIIFFLLVGFGKLPRQRRAKQREVCEAILSRTDGLDRVSHRDEWPSWLAPMVTMNRTLGSLPMVGGNCAELIEGYLGSIQAMADAIDAAEHFVHVEFFILVADEATEPVIAALERACCPRCRRPGAVRPRGPVHVPVPQGDAPAVRRDGRPLPTDAAAAAVPRAAGAGPTCATTGSWWWSTEWSDSPDRRTWSSTTTTRRATSSAACTGTS